RQASVHAGLEALAAEKPDIVLIHDAARPFVTPAVISRSIDAAGRTGAAVPVIPVTDTIKQVGDTGNVEATPERASLRIAQTPQAFRFDVILDAHRCAARDGRSDFTDDAALAEWVGLTVATFEGDPANMKLRTPEDRAAARYHARPHRRDHRAQYLARRRQGNDQRAAWLHRPRGRYRRDRKRHHPSALGR